MRLDKFLSHALRVTRNSVLSVLKSKKVFVNDVCITKKDFKISENDVVTYDGKVLEYVEYVYFLLNKPSGVVSATFDKKDKTVIDLLSDYDNFFSPFPVGRLDKDTEGLLLLTNDGELSYSLTNPKKDVIKTYYAKISKSLSSEDIEILCSGIILDGKKTKKANIHVLSSNEIHIQISEGKYHQVKRMLEYVNNKVLYLKRISIGNIVLPSDLEVGSYIPITKEEIYEKVYLTRK